MGKPNADKVKEQISLMLLEFMTVNGWSDTLVTFERESGYCLFKYGEELKHLRSLSLTGQFQELEDTLADLKEALPPGHFESLQIEIQLQDYLESLSSNEQSPVILQKAMNSFRDLQKIAPESLTSDLQNLLGLASVNDHPRFKSWTKLSGRLELFTKIEQSLFDVFDGGEKVDQIEYLPIVSDFLSRDLQASNIRNSTERIKRSTTEYAKQSHISLQPTQKYDSTLRESNLTASFQKSEFLKVHPEGSFEEVTENQTLGIGPLPKAAMISQISRLDGSAAFEEVPQKVDLPSKIKQSTRLSDIKRGEEEYINKTPAVSDVEKSGLSKSRYKSNITNEDNSYNKARELQESQDTRNWQPQESKSSNLTYRHRFDEDERNEAEGNIEASLSLSKTPGIRDGEKSYQAYAKSTSQFSQHLETVKESKIKPILEDYQASQIAASSSSALKHSAAFLFEDLIEIFSEADSLPIRAAGFSPDGEYMAVGSNSKKLTIYSVEAIINGFATADTEVCERSKVFELDNVQTGPIYTLDWAHNMEFLVLGSMDKTLKLFYTHVDEGGLSLTKSALLEGHEGIIRTVCTTSDSVPLIVSGGQDSYIRIWDSNQARLSSQIKGHHSHMYCAKVLLDNTSVYTVGVDKFIQVFDIRAGKLASKIQTQELAPMNYISSQQSIESVNFYELLSKTKHNRKTLEVHPTQLHQLMIAHQDGSMTLWDNRKMEGGPIDLVSIHSDDCRSVEFDPSGKYTVSTSFDLSTKIYDTVGGKVVTSLEYHSDRIVLAKWHPFFPIILSTSADCQCKVFASRSFIDSY